MEAHERVRHPSVALYDPYDSEQTRLTHLAQRALEDALEGEALQGFPVQFVRLDGGEVVVVEVHGQSSVTGHGKQGLRPDRLAFLRGLGYPVLLAFFEGIDSRREAWLHDLPEAQPISLETGNKRYGWPVSEMEKKSGLFRLPASVPAPVERAQGELI
ncbi:MAG TPA: hypothetical protein VF192_01130 [Longimicrobiales bacterium]